ncbi:cytochrome D1 domain-containing protein [Bradyrhizobium sp. WYCCWR 13022]|uniref:cytochrome D1 domain-containing protein n=1 Tax=unclassified Bradyrhizobium TaxID=2631580 RepID=UPI00263AE214|nr:cytochrome D1 domain-containing protein [Bradyrhizobium sp. WYCCWR 13022]MDN4984044.1 cytochrome D1 domain-containing protein [Bradyrhizobium sp. WYCCWR 13022]
MKRSCLSDWIAVALTACALAGPASAEPDAAKLFAENCAECHGADRLGRLGPALLPENLGRLTGARAAAVIADGRAATQMPGFAGKLGSDDIAALATYIASPLPSVPAWGPVEIEASRVVYAFAPELDRPRFEADPMNLFVVVEAGDHHATILDGDRFEPLTRFQTRFALHGGPKFTPDGRYVFFMSRDGWVSKYDLWTLTMLSEVRAGINARNIAISRDGKHIAVANYLPHTLVMLSTDDLKVEKVFEAEDRKGNSSRVSAVYQAPTRNSFIAALKDVPEIWEIATDPNAPPVYSGFVHSHEKGMIEALASSQGLFALRRIEVPEPLDDFFFDPPYRNLIGSAREGRAIVVNLTVGRDIKQLDLPSLPHLGSGISWTFNGRPVMATPLLKEGKISVLDLQDWSLIKVIDTPGPGFFMRSHENTPYAWADSMMSAKKDTLSIIDKRTLEVVRSVTPEPGKTAAHVEFDRDGRHALVSIWDDRGALVVYDAATFVEVKRIPMSRPSGKYNVWNKITFSDGTSH